MLLLVVIALLLGREDARWVARTRGRRHQDLVLDRWRGLAQPVDLDRAQVSQRRGQQIGLALPARGSGVFGGGGDGGRGDGCG